MRVQRKIIGGMFGLEMRPPALPKTGRILPPSLGFPHVLLTTARCALYALLEHVRPRQVWFPSYLCGVMLQAVRPGTAQIRFFPVNNSLSITDDTWLEDVLANDVVVFIDYFGFAGWTEVGAQVKSLGAVVVEDASQAFLSREFPAVSDYLIFSPRKFVGVPDGGILASRLPQLLPQTVLQPPPSDWWLDALRASVLRWEFDQHGGDRTWFELFRKTETRGPAGHYAISDLARALLLKTMDYAVIGQQRRANYQFLAAQLGELALIPELPQEVVPLGFPVRVPDRDAFRQKLFAAEIYPPVHWPIQGVVPDSFSESHQLARELMTLPCDQRYDQSDMERLADGFRRAL